MPSTPPQPTRSYTHNFSTCTIFKTAQGLLNNSPFLLPSPSNSQSTDHLSNPLIIPTSFHSDPLVVSVSVSKLDSEMRCVNPASWEVRYSRERFSVLLYVHHPLRSSKPEEVEADPEKEGKAGGKLICKKREAPVWAARFDICTCMVGSVFLTISPVV